MIKGCIELDNLISKNPYRQLFEKVKSWVRMENA